MRYVLYNDELGIYLGSCLGLGFWSKLDPVGQDSAVTFPSEASCAAHMESWDRSVDGCILVAVNAEDTYASVEQCVEAGLPGWNPNGAE